MTSQESYKEILEAEKYSQNTINNWLHYSSKLENKTLDQETIMQFIKQHNNKFARAFLKHYLETNNIKDLKIPKIKGRQGTPEIEYLEKTEIERLKKTATTHLKILISLMFEAGLRISEALNLQKKDIHYQVQDKEIIGATVKGKGKGKQPFTQPITARTAKDILLFTKDHKEEDYSFHWENVKSQRQKASYELKKAIKTTLGKNTRHPCHVFRHSCGTHLKYSGLDLRDIQVFLRHKQLQTVEPYIAVKKESMIKEWQNIMEETKQ